VISADYKASNGIINLNKLKIIWKEAAVAYFEVPFQYLFGGTEGNHEKSQRISRARFEILVFRIRTSLAQYNVATDCVLPKTAGCHPTW